MRTYNVPRNVKGEGRILFIFSTKALIYTAIGMIPGLFFYLIFLIMDMQIVGIISVAATGLIGFIIGTFKIPNSTVFKFTQQTGGENIDDVIKRWFKFKMQKTKVYIYKDAIKEEEDTKDDK